MSGSTDTIIGYDTVKVHQVGSTTPLDITIVSVS